MPTAEQSAVSPVAGAFFGQVTTDAPAVAMTTSDSGVLPRDLGNIFGPDGLGVTTPEFVGGATDLVAGVYRAVSGSPAQVVQPQPAAASMMTGSTLLVLVVLGVAAWLVLR